MKTRLFFILAVIFSSATFTACSEEEIRPETQKDVATTGSGDNDTNGL